MTRAHNDRLRNIAIIAHVDHGKTTLVDQMLRQAGTFRSGQQVAERLLDNLDLERERGITIAAKNCSLTWKDTKINIVDTPGHADFGGEVERALAMVEGAILLVDASEGPLPQTRYVLRKALETKKAMIVVINKIDRQDARIPEVLNDIYDLFIDLDATEDQIDFPVIYAIGRDGIAKRSPDEAGSSLEALFQTILDAIPPPAHDPQEPFQMLVTNLAYSDYLGRLAVGKVVNGGARESSPLVRLGRDGVTMTLRATKLQVYSGVSLVETTSVEAGEIVVLAGIDEVEIGDTIGERERSTPLRRIVVDEPTISMKFSVNTSPLAGREGKFVQSRKIHERLLRETLYNVALQVEESESGESFTVKGRGEFQMAILIETMRREGYELSVGRPQILYRDTNGTHLEPVEHLFIDCGDGFIGIVSEKLSRRKGRMTNLVNHGSGRARIEFSIPSRGLIGYRGEFLTDTKGTGLMNSYFEGYEPYRGDFDTRVTGSLVADRAGEAVPYALFHLEPRGTLFAVPGDPVYEGMIVGEHNRDNDLNVNPCKTKKLTNMRAAGRDENIILSPVMPLTLERAIEFIKDDELVEITPRSLRLRKTILTAAHRP